MTKHVASFSNNPQLDGCFPREKHTRQSMAKVAKQLDKNLG